MHRKLRGRVGLVLLVAAAAAIWWGLGRAEPRADWLGVEAPRRAVVGQVLPMRVHLAALAEPTRLCADLHWGPSRDRSAGYLATGGTQAVGKEGGTFDFEIRIFPRPELRFVSGILYLSRTGSWHDHTLVAATETIPVSSNTGERVETRLEQLRVQPASNDTKDHPRPAALPRLLTALLFLAAARAACAARQSPLLLSGRPAPEHRWWQALTVALALACLWELLGLESWLGAQARAIARAGDFYFARVVFQKVVISVAMSAMLLFLLFIRHAPPSRRLLLVSFALYLTISVVNLVSFHAIDKVADLSWHGLSLVGALKLGCAAMTLQGVRKSCREA